MGYVKDRYIGESVRLINDMLEYADKNNIEAILFSADFEKTFDSVDHTFILAVLKSYGLGPDFIQWVKIFLNSAESCVMNKDKSTGYFHSKREHAKEIRKDDTITGITIGNTVIKLSAYADDTYFLVKIRAPSSRYLQLVTYLKIFLL